MSQHTNPDVPWRIAHAWRHEYMFWTVCQNIPVFYYFGVSADALARTRGVRQPADQGKAEESYEDHRGDVPLNPICVGLVAAIWSRSVELWSGAYRVPIATMENGRGKKRRRLSAEDIERMSTDEMRVALTACVSELEAFDELEDNEAGGDKEVPVGGKVTHAPCRHDEDVLQKILDELRAMRAERAADRAEMTTLKQQYSVLQNTVAQQQRYLEYVDSRDRECNVIITGVPEDTTLDGATTDEDKVGKVLAVIEADSVPVTVSRLGVRNSGRCRPILVKTPSKEGRSIVLANTKKLKEADQCYRRVYVKKDIHPSIRKEWKRLRDAEEAERRKPANQGCTINLDTQRRVLTRDGVIIDRWQPSFFA